MSRRGAVLILLVGALAAGTATALPTSASTSPHRWVEVEFAAPLGAEQRTALEAAGATAVQPGGGSTYVAYAPRELRVAGARQVRPLTAADKGWSSFAGRAGLQAAVVLAHRSLRLDREFARLGGQVRAAFPMTSGGDVVAVTGRIDVRRLRELAQRPDVVHVAPASLTLQREDEASAQIMTGALDPRTKDPLPGYRAFLKRAGVTGRGVNVTVVDDGVDSGHPEFTGRVTGTQRNTPEPAQGHGTHVAGIIGGRAAKLLTGNDAKDAAGRLYGLGVAPDVTLIDMNTIALVNGSINFPDGKGFEGLTREALQLGSSLWNASWTTGEGAGVGYIANAAVFDGLARDGDASRKGNQAFTLVFSAGNSGARESTITAPKEAKNMIVVASSQNARGGLVLGQAKGKPDRISTFSSRGPARDGRIGITVTAPGENVVSARARAGALCTTDPPLDSAAMYSLCSGTSMAAPHATGAVALLTEAWRSRHRGAAPSPAMAKALLVNTARDIGERDVPNAAEGWGRIDLAALLDRSARRVTIDQTVRLDRVGDRHELRIAAVDPRRPMRATLVWTDAPGKPQPPATRRTENIPPALVNDLDLELAGREGTYRGNAFVDGRSVVGGPSDRLNNVENVFVDRPRSGVYRLAVRAAALPGDGVPGVGNRNDQDFALVLSNARLVR